MKSSVKIELKDYHKAALGLSWTPERLGRYWWQRNSYMLGAILFIPASMSKM